MWNSSRVFKILSHRGLNLSRFKRLFMSNSFSCEEAWQSRLKSPILQKVSVADFYYDLDNKFNQNGSISPVDVDIFIHSVKDSEHLDEMEDLVHKLRLSSQASYIFDSTQHGFIRNYLQHGSPDELMRILDDRLNYGVFPDTYCCLLLMDTFIKKEDYCNAAKVATLQMLQEDCTDDLVNLLSLYSCHKYLLNPTEWQKSVEEAEKEDDGEEVRVRVKFLKNSYFDGHFDLRHPDDLIGKTLLMISNNIDKSLEANYKLLGLVSYKSPETVKYLSEVLRNKSPVSFGIVDLAEQIISRRSETENAENSEEVLKLLGMIKNEGNCKEDDVLGLLEKMIRSLVEKNEQELVMQQNQTYENWENHRESSLKNELERLKKEMILAEIDKKKQEIKMREDELFFFEREEELDLTIENKRTRYPPKWLGKKKNKKSNQDDYIPPEITKQRN